MSTSSRSQSLYERALKVLPGGVSRNAVLRKPYPMYASHGQGCWLTDVDGVRRLDFENNMASLIHGHAHPAIVNAVTKQLSKGTAFTLASEIEVTYAEYLCSRNPGFERIRFVNSGTEAVMCCLKTARAFTNRPKIAKVEGAYHGTYDYAEVSQTATPANWGPLDHPNRVPVVHATPAGALDDVIVIPFNDVARSIALLNEHAKDIACVLIDPLPHRVGLSPASAEFIEALHAWTRRNGALMVFDEVITFRSMFGGAQEWYRVRPDLTALGKIIGGGFPVGAIAGRADVMEVLNPLAKTLLFPHSGTFSANPITLTAGYAAMTLFDRDAVSHVNALGERARLQINQAISTADVPASVTGGGSMFRLHLKPVAPSDYRDAYPTPEETKAKDALLEHLFQNQIMLINSGTGTISTPMTTADIDHLTEVLHEGLKRIRPMLPVGASA